MQYTKAYCIKINTAWAFFQSVKKSDEKLFQSLVTVAEQCESECNVQNKKKMTSQCESEFNVQNFDVKKLDECNVTTIHM